MNCNASVNHELNRRAEQISCGAEYVLSPMSRSFLLINIEYNILDKLK